MSKVTRGRKKKAAAALIILAVLAAFIWSPFSNYGISLAVMKLYGGIHERESLMAEAGIEIDIPGGTVTEEKDWYPFVMTYNPGDGFGRFTGEDAELSIMYNFPAFDVTKGGSMLFDPSSPYYNGFYGAYMIKGEDGDGNPYGFDKDGRLDLAAVSKVPEFDFQYLVLADFGLEREDMTFEWEIADFEEGVSYAGSDGWTRVDAGLTVNGAYHHRDRFRRSYLQYGTPAGFDGRGADFAPVEMKGRVYGKYFDEYGAGIFFYVMAADEGVLKACDEEILSDSRIREVS